MTQIYSDHNGLRVNAISRLHDGTDVEGHVYQALAGSSIHDIEFQQGPVPENGVNGMTNESVLAILIHRTEHLNNKFPCPENATAIGHMKEALAAFEARTKNRMERGVEGKFIE